MATLFAGLGFLVSVPLWFRYDPQGSPWQFTERAAWIPSIGASYFLGVDGYSALMVLMTTLLGFIAVLSSWTAVTERVKEYYICLLVLQTGMLGAFLALDGLLFFLFWEAMLVPMYLLIGIRGGGRRLSSAIKFFLYTLAGSVVLLLGILGIYFYAHEATGVYSFDITGFHQLTVPLTRQKWIFLALLVGFAINIPMFPLHAWLPDAHADAPTAGSVILAAVLLKMGAYGFVRFSLPILPEASRAFIPLVAGLSIVAIVYGALRALAQTDWKRLIAYSSISQMGMITLGLFAIAPAALSGSLLQQINHGISTGALFLIVGLVFERRQTREIAAFGGLWSVMPVFALLFLVMTLSSIGLPGLNGFVGEILILQGRARGAPLVGGGGSVRHGVGRRVHALAVPAHDVRPDHRAGERGASRPHRARVVDARAAGGAGGVDRPVPRAVPRAAGADDGAGHYTSRPWLCAGVCQGSRMRSPGQHSACSERTARVYGDGAVRRPYASRRDGPLMPPGFFEFSVRGRGHVSSVAGGRDVAVTGRRLPDLCCYHRGTS